MPIEYDERAVEKYLRPEGIVDHLIAVDAALADVAAFDASSTEATRRSVAEVRGVKAAALILAVRVALTGQAVSPGLFDAGRSAAPTRAGDERAVPVLLGQRRDQVDVDVLRNLQRVRRIGADVNGNRVLPRVNPEIARAFREEESAPSRAVRRHGRLVGSRFA